MTLQYEDIFSIFLSKITDYSFLEYDENFVRGQMVAWLRSSSSLPRLRAKFSEFSLKYSFLYSYRFLNNFTIQKMRLPKTTTTSTSTAQGDILCAVIEQIVI